MKQKQIKVDNTDLILAISLFQKLHPYTEILGISKEKWNDLMENKAFDVFVFKTNKTNIKIRTDNIIDKLF